MSNAGGQEPSKRVRITSPRRGAARRGPTRPATTEIDEQTGLGKVYIAALLRAQLRLSASVLVAVAAGLGILPLLFLAVPATHELRLWLIPLPWIILGVLVYPVVALAALYYVRHAEAIERDFADLVERR
jgi:glycerol-3-phosphate acyltransferase PlsY